MKYFLSLLLGLGLLSNSLSLRATHIVGGQMTYQLIDSALGAYEVELALYRDCFSGQAMFDSSIYLHVFLASDSSLDGTLLFSAPPTITSLPIPSSYSCFGNTSQICIEQGGVPRHRPFTAHARWLLPGVEPLLHGRFADQPIPASGGGLYFFGADSRGF